MANRLLAWLDSDPMDVGLACRDGLKEYRATGSLSNGDADTLGNGGLLRVLPLALDGLPWTDSVKHSNLTHAAPAYGEYIRAYHEMVVAALQGNTKAETVSIVDVLKPIGMPLMNGGDVGNTLISVLSHFATTDSFEDAIIKATNCGNDSDSVAVILGGLAGSFYGFSSIPKRWIVALDKRVNHEMESLAHYFAAGFVLQI